MLGGICRRIEAEGQAMSETEDTNPRAVVVQTIKDGLSDANGAVDGAWLNTLHTSYVSRYQADIDRTWSTATWLVALAWTLFPAAVAFNQRMTPGVVLIYGITSIALVLLWLVIASVHRVWASRSYDIVRAIERLLLGTTEDDKLRAELKRRHRAPWLLGGYPMWFVRWLILAGTVAGWIWLGVAVSTGDFPPPEVPATPTPAG
jgi:hypothetical protein